MKNGYNKSISNKSFDKKKEVYAKSKVKMTKSLVDIKRWDEKAIQDREAKLNDVMMNIWTLD